MHAEQRILWAKRMNWIQFIINAVLILGALIFGGTILDQLDLGALGLFAIPAVLAGLLGLIIPLVVIYALDRRTQIWGIAAYALMGYEVLTGLTGGVLAILPLIALIFLADKETYETVTGNRSLAAGV